MGKTRGHGSRRGAYRGRGRGRGGGEDDDSEEEQFEAQRSLGGQKSNVGMLPPSDSDSDEAEPGKKEGGAAAEEKKQSSKASGSKAGQSKNAGELPPSDSGDEDEDESSEDESSEEPLNEYLSSAPRPKKKVEEEAPDPEQIRKDLERLEMIKQKREDDRLKRIRDEGWDRFAPLSDTNKPPGHVPSDHPSQKE